MSTPANDDAPRRAELIDALRLHPRLLLATAMVGVAMLPVGLLLAALGVLVLDVAGGAADDTSLVVGIAGFLVADFWGGGIVAGLTRARAPQVALAWGIVRAVLLVLGAVFVERAALLVPIQLLLAVPAAYAGARVSRKQAALRRHARAELRDAEVR